MMECCRDDDTHPEHAITGLLFPGWVDPDVGWLYISNRHRSPSARFCVIYDCRQPFTFQLPWDMIRTERINLTRRLEIATICLIILESVVIFLVIYGCRPTSCVYFWLYISLYLCRRRYGRWEFQNNIYITNQKMPTLYSRITQLVLNTDIHIHIHDMLVVHINHKATEKYRLVYLNGK